MRVSQNLLRIIAGTLVAGHTITPIGAVADVRILESNVPEIRAPAILPDSAQFGVPAGGRVVVIILPSRVEKIIIGPFHGRAADYNRLTEGTGTIPNPSNPPFG